MRINSKKRARSLIRRRRRSWPPATLSAWDRRLCIALAQYIHALSTPSATCLTIAIFVPVNNEPGAHCTPSKNSPLTHSFDTSAPGQGVTNSASFTESSSPFIDNLSTLLTDTSSNGHEPYVRFIVPRVSAPGTLTWHLYTPGCLTRGAMNLLEPHPQDPVDLTEADLIVAPALGYSVEGIRLGQGGGFYDRAVSDFRHFHQESQKVPPVIGVAHPGEIFPALPYDSWDIRMDGIITALGFIAINP